MPLRYGALRIVRSFVVDDCAARLATKRSKGGLIQNCEATIAAAEAFLRNASVTLLLQKT